MGNYPSPKRNQEFSNIPDEVWILIFEYLTRAREVAQVNHHFYKLAKIFKRKFVFNQDPTIDPSLVVQYLSFSNCTSRSFSNYSLQGSIWREVHLEKLKLSDEDLKTILSVCPNIEILFLQLNTNLTEGMWHIIRDNAKQLKDLTVGSHLQQFENLLDSTTKTNNQIEKLHLLIEKRYFYPKLLTSAKIAKFTKLKHLTIPYIHFEPNTQSNLESITFTSVTGLLQQPIPFSDVFPNVKHFQLSDGIMENHLNDSFSDNIFLEQFQTLCLETINLEPLSRTNYMLNNAAEALKLIMKQTENHGVKRLLLPKHEMIPFRLNHADTLQELILCTEDRTNFYEHWSKRLFSTAKHVVKLRMYIADFESVKLLCKELGPQLKVLHLVWSSSPDKQAEPIGMHFKTLQSLTLEALHSQGIALFLSSLSKNEFVMKSLKTLCLSHCSLPISLLCSSIPKFYNLEFLHLDKIIEDMKSTPLLDKHLKKWRTKFTVWNIRDPFQELY